MELEKGLWYEGAKHFGDIKNIRSVLLHARHNLKEHKNFNPDYIQRIQEFKETIDILNNFFSQESIDNSKYKNLADLKDTFKPIGNHNGSIVPLKLITPEEVQDIYTDPYKRRVYSVITEAVDPFFAKLHEIVVKKEWEFPTEITDNPNKVISGMLIEGYGLFLEDFYKKEGLQRKFVLAFEEVLVLHKPESKILSDVSDWMKEEEV
ncbi:MAG: hypothetical protein Q8P80_04815 [Candidatus Levybacteria bacterium]|nr:hypothetical protein [Candidatus Levybacteria bacterium]